MGRLRRRAWIDAGDWQKRLQPIQNGHLTCGRKTLPMTKTFAAALLAASTLSTIPAYAAGFDPMGPVLAEARDHDRDSRHERKARSHHDDKRGHRDHDRRRDVRHVERHVDRHVDRHVHRHVDRHVERHVVVHQHPRYRVGHYYRPVGYRSYAWHRGARLPAGTTFALLAHDPRQARRSALPLRVAFATRHGGLRVAAMIG